jgi:hypothetical protein
MKKFMPSAQKRTGAARTESMVRPAGDPARMYFDAVREGVGELRSCVAPASCMW